MKRYFTRLVAFMAVIAVLGVVTMRMITRGAAGEGSSALATSASAPATTSAPAPPQAREPITIAVAGLLAAMTLEEVAQSAELIVLGTVVGPPASRWNTPSGTLPPDVPIERMPPATYIFTDTPVKVQRYLKGMRDDNMLLVRSKGGTVGQDITEVDSTAQLRVGKPVVLFLKSQDVETGNIGPEHYIVVEGIQGMYEVVGDQAVSKGKQLPLAELLNRVNGVK